MKPEYTTHWANNKHEYEKFLKKNNIRHTKIKLRTPQSNEIVERFNRTLLEEFYQIAIMKKVYSSLSELQDDLDKFIKELIYNLGNFLFEYNHLRRHGGLEYITPYEKLEKVTKLLN